MEARKVSITIGAIAALLVLAMMLIRFLNGSMIGTGTRYASVIRVISSAEASYAASYPNFGFAPNLSALGPTIGPGEDCSALHACLIDNVLACPESIGEGWCPKSGYRYNIQSSSKNSPYKDYWLSVTPISLYEKGKSYCLTSDGKLRSETVTPLVRPYSLQECLALPRDPIAETGH